MSWSLSGNFFNLKKFYLSKKTCAPNPNELCTVRIFCANIHWKFRTKFFGFGFVGQAVTISRTDACLAIVGSHEGISQRSDACLAIVGSQKGTSKGGDACLAIVFHGCVFWSNVSGPMYRFLLCFLSALPALEWLCTVPQAWLIC